MRKRSFFIVNVMHDFSVLAELVKVLAMAAVVVGVFHRFRLPSIAGFLVAGVLLGPGVTGLVADRHNVEVMAELGVVLLMFTIGLEFSARDMIRMRKLVFGGGAGQMAVTTLVFAMLLRLFDLRWPEALLLGSALALSSTAIVLKLLGDRGELGQVHGRFVLGTLLFQDVAVVALMLLVPVMLGDNDQTNAQVAWNLGKAFALAGLLVGGAFLVFPRLLKAAVALRSSELFRVITMLTVLGTAWIAGEIGLSLALGAFVAGMVIADSPFSHQMHSDILPLRDVFNGIFFVSVGMLFDPTVLVEQPVLVVVMTSLVIGLKLVAAFVVARLLGLQRHEAWLGAASLSQVGEFAYVLGGKINATGVLADDIWRTFVNVTVISMLVTPALIPLAHRIAPRLQRSFAPGSSGIGDAVDDPAHVWNDHVIIVGYGLKGRTVSRVLTTLGVRYRIAETNAQVVIDLKAQGESVMYGDACQAVMLEYLGVRSAKAIVITVPDPADVRAIVTHARELNPDLRIIARTRYVTEVTALHGLGADDVVPEELETSLELAGHVMEAYGAGSMAVERQKMAIRAEQYETLLDGKRRVPENQLRMQELLLHIDLRPIRVPANAGAVGQTLKSLNLRACTGASIIAAVRELSVIANPTGDFVIEPDDVLMLMGHGDQIEAAEAVLHDPRLAHGTLSHKAITRTLRAVRTGAFTAIPPGPISP